MQKGTTWNCATQKMVRHEKSAPRKLFNCKSSEVKHRNMKKIKHENSATWKNWNIKMQHGKGTARNSMKKIKTKNVLQCSTKKDTIWQDCNTKKVQLEKNCNMTGEYNMKKSNTKRVQHEMSATWSNLRKSVTWKKYKVEKV